MPLRSPPSSQKTARTIIDRATSLQFVHFLFVGAGNTLVAYCAYLVLVQWLSYPIAWGIGYLLGIATGYTANAFFVFKKPLHHRPALAFLSIYLLQYLASVLLLKIALQFLMMPHWLAAIVVILVTTPPMFLLVRLVMNSKS